MPFYSLQYYNLPMIRRLRRSFYYLILPWTVSLAGTVQLWHRRLAAQQNTKILS
jgi:hypothetical protein